jgi:3-methyladenine DNA glycosylase Mpg
MSDYVKQSITITKEQRETLERFSKVLRKNKLDVSISALIRILIDNGADLVRFRIMDKEFVLTDEKKEEISYGL